MGKNDTLFKDRDPQKTDPIWGVGTYLSVPYIGVGAPPQVPPPWGNGLITSLCLGNETVLLPGKDILLWEEKDWTQENCRH